MGTLLPGVLRGDLVGHCAMQEAEPYGLKCTARTQVGFKKAKSRWLTTQETREMQCGAEEKLKGSLVAEPSGEH